ncbi:hypothetical protein Pelo_19283 [Pelomyxa schiedti]|nr:hypothetical protein Pelo_19283 [Pelomyxa schiedti]
MQQLSDQVGTLPTKTRPFWITGAGTRPQVCLPLPLDFTAVENTLFTAGTGGEGTLMFDWTPSLVFGIATQYLD